MTVLAVHPFAKSAPQVWNLSGDACEAASTTSMAVAPFKLLMQVRGVAEVAQHGRRSLLEPGHFTLIDGAQPFSMTASGGFAQVLVTMPRPSVLRQHRGIERRTALVHAGLGAEAIVRDFVTSLARHTNELPAASSMRAIGALIKLLGGLQDASAGSDPQASLIGRAQALIDVDLADITADKLAARLHVSRRHLDAVFARTGQSVTQHIWAQRLSQAAEQLQQSPSLPIAEIAYAVGFKDASHFSRMFARHHGVAPGAWRRRGAVVA